MQEGRQDRGRKGQERGLQPPSHCVGGELSGNTQRKRGLVDVV